MLSDLAVKGVCDPFSDDFSLFVSAFCVKPYFVAMHEDERARRDIRSCFDTALYSLKNDVLMMSSLVDRMIQVAFEAFLQRDSESCDHIGADDEEIDILEKQVDQEAIDFTASISPVATAMREVVAQ